MTRNFLVNKIQSVFEEFIYERWCDLDGSKLCSDDYSSIVCQQRYILKYYGAYFCELYGLYEGFLRNFDGDELNILSLGCGNGVDCEALNRVMIDLNTNITINYVGVDIVDWSYRPDFEWAQFLTLNVEEIDENDVKNIDLFIFPKSLTEFSTDARTKLGETIAKNNNQKHIYFMNTYVTDCASNNQHIDGISQFKTIHKILKTNDWICQSKPSEYFYKTNQGWLGYNFDFFKLPDELKPFVENLKENCEDYHEANCTYCDIDFIPILNSRYLAWNTLEYQKLD